MDNTKEADRCLVAIVLLIKSQAGVHQACRWPPTSKHDEHTEGTALLSDRLDLLDKLLGAEGWNDGKQVEVTLGATTFISHATYLRDESDGAATTTSATRSKQPSSDLKHGDEYVHKTDKIDFALRPSGRLDTPEAGTSVDSTSEIAASPARHVISMFQIIFALHKIDQRAPSLTTDTLFEHIMVPLSTSLKQLQEHSQWLSRQYKASLASQQDQHGSRSRTAGLDGSLGPDELTWALQELYEAIEVGQVASIRLGGIHMSLQIPSKASHDSKDSELSSLALEHLAILLLEDKSALLQELDHGPGSAALAFFLTRVVPTKSLSKLATKLNLHIDAVVFLAKHLVKWRKARLIAPLHARNTYVLNPEAGVDDLASLEQEYNRRFPALLSLQTMLNTIGALEPAAYGSSIPSRAHRDIYLDILAWLMRHDLVVRLRTVAWLCYRDIATAHEKDQVSELGSKEGEHSHGKELTLITQPSVLTSSQKSFIRGLMGKLRDKELESVFTQILPYLDGEHCLEDVASQEGLKRAKVDECLQALQDLQALRSVQVL